MGHWMNNMVGSTFAGVPMAQYQCDLLLWERALNHAGPLVAIVEVGTYQGGFSLFLHAQAHARGLRFHTFDVIEPDRAIPGFARVDVFRHPEAIECCLTDGPVALFCDGGNKPREFQTFAPMTRAGSIIAVHDWRSETKPEDVEPLVLDGTVEPFLDWLATDIDSITRFYRRL
jgi:cephalosporin hydroxylase